MTTHVPKPGPGLCPISGPMMQVLQSVETAMQDRQGPAALIDARAQWGRWTPAEPGSPRAVMLESAMAQIGTQWSRETDNWSLIQRCAEAAGCDGSISLRREGHVWGGVREAEARRALLAWGFREVRPGRAEPGDVLLFSMKGNAPWLGDDDFAHAAILSEPGGRFSGAVTRFNPETTARMVHRTWGRACCEAFVGEFWEGRTLAAFTLDSGIGPRAEVTA